VRAIAPLKTIDFGPSSANMVAFDPSGMFDIFAAVGQIVVLQVSSWFLSSTADWCKS